MQRFIIVNPEAGAIQGDIMCGSAAAAVGRLEAALTAGTDNETWSVYHAPAGFPAPGQGYSALDAGLLALVASRPSLMTAPNGRRAAASLALAG